MTSLVVFDSLFGNTQAIASVIGETISTFGSAKVLGVNEVTSKELDGVQLLIVGSPTQGGRPTELMQKFLQSIATQALVGVQVAAFDTRFPERDQKLPLKLLMKTIGYAAPKIAAQLQKKGGKLVVPAEGFIVNGKQGPLAAGETERAKVWTLQFEKLLSP